MACEFDSGVYELTKRNIAGLDRTIDLQHGDYQSLLADRHLPPDHVLIFFIAPPWGTALDEVAGLDLRRTTPPVTDIRINHENISKSEGTPDNSGLREAQPDLPA